MDAPQKNPHVLDPAALKELWHYNLTGHPLTAEGTRRLTAIENTAKAMADAVIDLTPAGRDQALALTGVETIFNAARNAISRQFNTDNEDIPEEDKQLKKESKDKA